VLLTLQCGYYGSKEEMQCFSSILVTLKPLRCKAFAVEDEYGRKISVKKMKIKHSKRQQLTIFEQQIN